MDRSTVNGSTRQNSDVNSMSVQVLLSCEINVAAGMFLLTFPQFGANSPAWHVRISNPWHHRPKVFDMLHIMPRQIGEQILLLLRRMV